MINITSERLPVSRGGGRKKKGELLWSFAAALWLGSLPLQAGTMPLGVLGQSGARWPAGWRRPCGRHRHDSVGLSLRLLRQLQPCLMSDWFQLSAPVRSCTSARCVASSNGLFNNLCLEHTPLKRNFGTVGFHFKKYRYYFKMFYFTQACSLEKT